MKSKKCLYGLVIAFVVMAGVLTGVGLGKHYVSSADVDYKVSTSDSSGDYDYFLSSDNWLVSLGWANNSAVSNFSDLKYTGSTLYYKLKFFLGRANSENNNIILWGTNLVAGTDNPTASSSTSGYSVVNATSTYGVYITQTLGWNYTSSYNFTAYSNIYGLRFHSTQNTSRYNVVYFQALCYSDDSTLPSIDFNMGTVEMGNYTASPYSPVTSGLSYGVGSASPSSITSGYFNWVSYLSLDGNYRFTFFVSSFYDTTDTYANAPFNYLEYRRYILQTENLSSNNYYQQGYTDGYSNGENSGYSDGYQVGSNNGYNTGYNVGYQTGLNSAHQFTFLNLMGAVVDAPISAFRGLFDFTILGINMADFLASLLTLCVIFLVVKFVFLK